MSNGHSKGAGNDDECELKLGSDTISHDTQRIACCMYYISKAVLGMLCILFTLVIFSLIVGASVWAISELDAVADIYSSDCDGILCKRVTYADRVRKLEPCARMTAARCVMFPSNWVFVPMIPVYQYMTGRDLRNIWRELPLLLRERCLLCYGEAFERDL